jgi:hypothetical protein
METRQRHGIPTACPITPRDNQPRGDGLISVNTAAQQLQTHHNTIVLWARKGILYTEHKAGICPLWVRLTPQDTARLTQSSIPPNSLRIRQACQRLHMKEAQFWAEVRAGRYMVYRVRENNHWVFRVTLD